MAGGVSFCCAGCESVHALLMSRGLGHFYELRDRYSFQKPRMPVESAPASAPDAPERSQQYYIEGIHCLGCLWLLEKLPEIDSRIRKSSLDCAHHLLDLEISDQISWPEVAALISRLGYSARAVAGAEAANARNADARRQLARIGIAAFGAGNIMLLSVSVYAGSDPGWASRFSWLSLALALPVLLYSAWPIYRAAFQPLAQGRLSVDLAIASALVAGAVMSLWSLLSGKLDQVYFDSLTMLVFLLLSSRYLLMKFRESLAKDGHVLHLFSSEEFWLSNGNLRKAEALQAGDELELRENQTLPVDAILTTDRCHFDFSLLTGESLPAVARAGDLIEAGATLRSPAAALRVQRAASESRLAQILAQIKTYQLQRTPTLEFADRLGKYFVAGSLLGAALLLALVPGQEGMRRALALVIVTCPCVLAFAVPLALTRAMQIAARRGILFVKPAKLEALAGVQHIFLDKTGTLTTGSFEVLEWHQEKNAPVTTKAAALALERNTSHPVGKAIARFCRGAEVLAAEVEELPGYGRRGRIGREEWQIGKSAASASGTNSVALLRNGAVQAEIVLGDSLRPDSRECVAELRKQGLGLTILSGDHARNVAAIALEAGIPQWHGDLLPEQKARLVKSHPRSAMVGDGANDALAFQTADVGIAVQGSIDLGVQNSDLVLTRPGLQPLIEARRIAERAMQVVCQNFAVTFSYNLFAGTLAAAGLMQPLWAAILMPLSALSVFALTQWRLREEKV